MSVNIGTMLRAWLGEAAPAEGRALELRIGQIVRGVLLEMLEDGDAIINVGGVSVRAKLEADLQVGKGTLLQVMPGRDGGTIVLKALGEAAGQMPDESLKDALKSFGLPDQKWSFELLRGLRRDGYPINKDTGAFFQAASALKPAGADTAAWMSAADVAFRRGLPPAEETLNALRQALFGQPLREELAVFVQKLTDWLDGEGAKSPKAVEWAGRLNALLSQGEALLAQGAEQLSKGSQQRPGAEQTDSLRRTAAAQTSVPEGSRMTNSLAQIIGDAAKTSDMQGLSKAASDLPQPAVKPAAASGPPASGSPAPGTAFPPAGGDVSDEGPVAGNLPKAAVPEGVPPQTSIRPESMTIGGNAMQHVSAAKDDSSWIGRFLQWLGVSHEHQLMQEWGDIRRGAADLGAMNGETPSQAGDRPASDARNSPDSLKSVLLAMTRQEDLPPMIRDAAQSLVHQITGQQLLLASERQSGNPMSMMTFFVPMKSPDGETTATIHVQTRRSRKGEWDAGNCRLLFDLRMRYLGETIVDVQVVNRIVSVKLMNDFPGMAEMAAQAREQLEEGFRDAGFQLLSLTVQPHPPSRQSAAGEGTDNQEPKLAGPAVAAFAAKPYKGVDFRV